MSEIRVPTQKRSIEKKNIIIEKGFELMCENGFYNTNTTEIAKYAGVSTGIIYQYFNDKKDIFLEGVKNYFTKIMFPMLNVLETKIIDSNNLESIINEMIDEVVKNHTMSKKAHEELMAMTHLDEDIADIFRNNELDMTKRIIKLFNDNNINTTYEKIHICMGIIDNLCHEIVYHKHKEIDYDVMKNEVIKIIINLINC